MAPAQPQRHNPIAMHVLTFRSVMCNAGVVRLSLTIRYWRGQPKSSDIENLDSIKSLELKVFLGTRTQDLESIKPLELKVFF